MDNKINYYLYRNLYDIIHPSISRQNISDYKIKIDNNLVPLQIYYPDKNVIPEKLIIYIPDKIKNYSVYNELAKKTNTLVSTIESTDKKDYMEYYNIINYIYQNIEKTGIKKDNIIIMTDNYGSEIEEQIIKKIKDTKDFTIDKTILLNPKIKENSIYDNKNALVILDESDKIKNSNNYIYIDNYLDDFITGNNIAIKEGLYSIINNFIN